MTDPLSGKDKLTLRLEGDVSLGNFAKALSSLSKMLRQIEREITGKNEIEWSVTGLRLSNDETEDGGEP